MNNYTYTMFAIDNLKELDIKADSFNGDCRIRMVNKDNGNEVYLKFDNHLIPGMIRKFKKALKEMDSFKKEEL